MRCLEKNKRRFWYALYLGKEEILDSSGNHTGEYRLLYSDPIESMGNISAGQGYLQTWQFGGSERFDKTIVMDDPFIPIDEYTILWVDSECVEIPSNADGDELGNPVRKFTPHDYTVRRVSRSLNVASILAYKVNVSNE